MIIIYIKGISFALLFFIRLDFLFGSRAVALIRDSPVSSKKISIKVLKSLKNVFLKLLEEV